LGVTERVDVLVFVRVVLLTGIQERQIKLDAVLVVRRLERMGGVELGPQGLFPLLDGHEGVVEGDVRGEVEGGLLVGDGGAEVRGV